MYDKMVAAVGNDPTSCAFQAHTNPSQLSSVGYRPGFAPRSPGYEPRMVN